MEGGSQSAGLSSNSGKTLWGASVPISEDQLIYWTWRVRKRKAKDSTKSFVLSSWKNEMTDSVGKTGNFQLGECFQESEL